jgi:aspartyl-tRNA(Asn)/glutamyl-tRNA(Gln) amidotransferase subunit A
MPKADLALLSAVEIADLFRTKQASPVEAALAALARVRAHDGAVNAFCLVDEEAALAQARASEARWANGAPLSPLDGVPATIKDVVLSKRWPTLRGSRAVARDGPWNDDAPAVARLREAGCVFLGKTTTPEFGWKGVTDSPLTGITRNPWNTGLTPGGSSGGAAAAAALHMGALHIGTDAGGSIRIPAGFTGVFGLKPSFGRVPVWPPSPFGTLSHLGPMTRTVADAARMLTAIARPDARDWLALPYEGRDYEQGLDDGVAGLRLAFSPDLGYARVDPEVADCVREAVQVFADMGAVVEEAGPGFANPFRMFLTHWSAGAAFLLSQFAPEQRALMDPGLVEFAEKGRAIALTEYLEAAKGRADLAVGMRRFHERYDLLLTPALPITAFRAGQEVPDPTAAERWADWTPFTYPFNLSLQPAAAVPCGFSQAGLPIALQIVGPMHGDALVLRAARAFERLRPFRMPEAPIAGAGGAPAAAG